MIEAFRRTGRKMIGCAHIGRSLTNAQPFYLHHPCHCWEVQCIISMPQLTFIAGFFSDSIYLQWATKHFNLQPVELGWSFSTEIGEMEVIYERACGYACMYMDFVASTYISELTEENHISLCPMELTVYGSSNAYSLRLIGKKYFSLLHPEMASNLSNNK